MFRHLDRVLGLTMTDLLHTSDISFSGTHPLEVHLLYIRNLSNSAGMRSVLADIHGYSESESRKIAIKAARFVDLGLTYLDAASAVPERIRPVMQYYGYMNLAVAVVLIHRPTNWEKYRTHGAQDRTGSLSHLQLGSKVVEIGDGVLGLFNCVITGQSLPRNTRLTLRDLLNPIPMLTVELKEHFNHNAGRIRVWPTVTIDTSSSKCECQIKFEIVANGSDISANQAFPFPAAVFEEALPLLTSDFVRREITDTMALYVSKRSWNQSDFENAIAFRNKTAWQCVNFGGHSFVQESSNEESLEWIWQYHKRCRLLATLPASLLTSFLFSSLARYRPNLLDSVEETKINLLGRMFLAENPGFMIPAFRNLYYGRIHRVREAITY